MAVSAGCGGESTDPVAERTTPSATASSTSVGQATPTGPAFSTTIAPQALTVVPNPSEPANAGSFTVDGENLRSAAELPNGDLLVSVTRGAGPDLLPDRCSTTIYRVDPKSGDRSLFNVGGRPLVSPDGQRVVFADVGEPFPYWGGVACDVSRLTIRPLNGGPDVVLDEFRLPEGTERTPLQASVTSWSPDGARFIVYVDSYAGWAIERIYDPKAPDLVVPVISDALDAALRASTPAQAEQSWEVFLGPWLSDNTLVVTAYDRSAGPTNYQPRRFVLDDGDVVDVDDEITDPVLLGAIEAWERAL